jgi:phage terminase large subunit-like protein
MRAASNPGGPGHSWVKGRFIESCSGSRETSGDARAVADAARTPTSSATTGRVFIPATIADNPHLDADEYRRSLAHLPSVLRQRLERGDWSIHEAGLIQHQWLRYYAIRGQILDLLDAAGNPLAHVDERACRRFATVDPAGTSADRAAERRGRPASWSVIQVWDQPRARELSSMLILRHVKRERVGFDGLCSLLRHTYRTWRPQKIWIENEKLGQAACDVLRRELPIACIGTLGRDKLTRAAPLIVKLERGEIFLPRVENSWLMDLETEWLTWSGLEDEPADQIDAAAYAVQVVEKGMMPNRVKLIWPLFIR